MAVGFYDKEGKLISLHDGAGSLTWERTETEVNGKYCGVMTYGDGVKDVCFGSGHRRIYTNQQGQVLAVGNGHVLDRDVLSRAWYVIAPMVTVMGLSWLDQVNNEWVFCGLPLASVGLMWLARNWQLNHYFPDKLEL